MSEDNNKSLVSVLYDLINDFVRIPLLGNKEWGNLMKTEAGRVTKKEFIGDFESFLRFLDS